MKPDIVEELKCWGAFKVGDGLPNDWGPKLTALLNEAATEIVRLRSLAGAVTPGPDLVDLRGLIKTNSTGTLWRCSDSPSDKPKTEYPDWMSMK